MSAPPKLIIDNFLTEDERNSSVWQSVRTHLQRMLDKRRLENDNPLLTDVQSAALRGHIRCLKEMISLGDTPPAMTAPATRPRPRRDLGALYG